MAPAATAATLTRTILDSGGTVALYDPSVALGSDGVLHIVAQGRPVGTITNSTTTEIYYLSYNTSTGTVRAASVINTADAVREGRPKIALTSAGKAVVVWAGAGQTLKAVLLNPTAAPASLIEVAETVIGASTGGGHLAVAVDGNGKAHVVRTTTAGMLHTRFVTATLVADVVEHIIGTTDGSSRGVDPGLGIDSNNRLHVVYGAADVNAQGPAAYMMLNDDGVLRIAPTALFQRAGVYAHAAHLSLVVESPTLVHVVYGDKRNTPAFNRWAIYKSGGTAFYTRLNPGADDQSGDAATLATITVGTESTIGGYWYGQAFLSGGSLHFLTGASQSGGGNLVHIPLNAGTGAVGEPGIFTAQNGGWTQGKWYIRGAGNAVVWAEEIYSPTLTGITTQLVSATLAAVTARPDSGTIIQDDGGSLSLTLLAGLGLLLLARRRLAGPLLAFAAVFAAGPSAAATLTRTVLDNGNTIALYNPSLALGSDGVVHIAAQGRSAADPQNDTLVEIYYLSYNPASGTIRAPTVINTVDAAEEGRAKIALTAAGKAVVVWAGNNQAPRAVLLNPAAAPASLIEVAETVIGVNTAGGHFGLAIDGNGKGHVVRAVSGGLLHTRFLTATLVPDVVEHAVGTSASSSRQVDPGLGIDSNNRLHVVYSAADVNAQGPAAYMMLDDTGTVRIAPTALFQRAGVYAHAVHFSLIVQSPTLIHVVYGDKRNTKAFGAWSDYKNGGTAFYTRLNPGLDDQNGDAATLATIAVGTETTIGGYWYGQAFLSDSTLHFLTGASMSGGGDLLHVALNTSTGAAGEPRTYTAQNGGWSIGKKYVRGAGTTVVWAEEIYSPTLTGTTTQLVATPVSAVAARPSVTIIQDDGGALGWPLLASLAGLALVRRRMRAAG